MKAYQWWWNDGTYQRFERGLLQANSLQEAYAVVREVMGDGGASVRELPMCTREQYQKQRKEGSK